MVLPSAVERKMKTPHSMNKVITVILLIHHCLSGIDGVGLETSPPAVDGVLTSCAETSLTCSHNNTDGGTTTWTIAPMDSSSILCVASILHSIPMPGNPYVCNAFVFENITGLTPPPTLLNSTATVNPLPPMLNGTRMECSASGSNSPSVGTVTFCIIDQTSSLTNLRVTLISSNLTSVILEWDPLSTCSRDPVSYTLTIDGSPVPAEMMAVESDTRYIVSGLQPNQRYMANVSATVTNCMTASANLDFEITARTPRPMVAYETFCANSSETTAVKISWTFPSSAPDGIIYPPTDELSVTVTIRNESGQMVANTTLSDIQFTFFDVSNDEAFSVDVTASHEATGSNSSTLSTLSSQLCTIDTAATSVNNSVIVRLSGSCTEDSTMFSSTLTYGSCTISQNMSDMQMFNSSGTSSFLLNVANLVGSVCLRAVTTHQNGLSRSCVGTNGMVMQQLTFNPCPVETIHAAAGTGVTVTFSPNVTSGNAPHGTTATFSASGSLVLNGPRQSFCQNGTWDDLSMRTATSTGGFPGWAIALIIIGLLLIALGVAGILMWRYPCWKKKEKSSPEDATELNERKDEHKDEPATYADPNSIDHQQAPGGEEYAVVAKSGKKEPEVSGALYQDPSTIKHEEAPTGDLYAVTEKPKKGSKKTKEPTEQELSQMYSVPDKTRRNQGGLTYAEIDLPSGSKVPVHHPTEYATVVD